MRKTRRAAVLSVSVFLAAGSGYIMQNSDSLGQRPDLAKHRVATAPERPFPMNELRNIQQTASIAAVSTPSLANGPAPLPIIALRDVSEVSMTAQVAALEDSEMRGFDLSEAAPKVAECAAGALVVAEASFGLARVDLMAPCHPQEAVRLSDGALAFDIMTDDEGFWAGLVPATAQVLVMRAEFADGEAASAELAVQGAPAFRQVALNWAGADALRLNAFEYGSGVDGVGHVSAGAPRSPDTQLGGYILTLGDVAGGARAEVYLAPIAMTGTTFDLEALITDETCANDLSGRLIRTAGGAQPDVTEFNLAMPACDAVGSSLLMDLPELPVELALAD